MRTRKDEGERKGLLEASALATPEQLGAAPGKLTRSEHGASTAVPSAQLLASPSAPRAAPRERMQDWDAASPREIFALALQSAFLTTSNEGEDHARNRARRSERFSGHADPWKKSDRPFAMKSQPLRHIAKKLSEQNVFLAIGVQEVSRGSIMIELAHNARGGALSVPARAAGWRVRRMEPHGPLKAAYGRNGRPLRLALAATAHDLHREVRRPGRYRLDLIDARGKALPRVQPAFAQIPEGTACPPAPKTEIEREIESLHSQLHALVTAVLEVARRNTELARLVVR